MTIQIKPPRGQAGAERTSASMNSSHHYSAQSNHFNDNLAEITSRLKGVIKRIDGGILAFCPSHDDKRGRSLAASVGCENQILLHCFAGCSIHEITQAIGLNPSDLFPKTENKYDPQTRHFFNEWQILSSLQHDATVVLIAARSMLSGKALPESDVTFLSQAAIRINDAISYSRRFK